LAHAFLREYSCKTLKLAQPLGQLGALLTLGESAAQRCTPRIITGPAAGPKTCLASWRWPRPFLISCFRVTSGIGQPPSARAANRRFWLLSALRAHTKAPYKIDLHWETLRALSRPWRARTVDVAPRDLALGGLRVSTQRPGGVHQHDARHRRGREQFGEEHREVAEAAAATRPS
jgi:hypothetical protein